MTDSNRALAVGDHGPRVAHLHAQLLTLGVDLPHDELVETMFASGTRRAILAYQRQHELWPSGIVDDTTIEALDREVERVGRYVVGLVLGPDGRPAPGVLVQAFDRDLRGEDQLGEAESGDDGFYLIAYDLRAGRRAEAGTADVFVRATLDGKVLTDPPVEDTVFNAPEVVSITVVLPVRTPPRETEYEHAVRVVEPVLRDVAWTDLRQDAEQRDVTFLTGETGLPAHRIEHVAVGHRMSAEFGSSPALYYAVFASGVLVSARRWATATPRFRIDLSTSLPELFYDLALLSTDELEAAVREAVDHFVVPRSVLDELGGLVEALAGVQERATEYVRTERREVLFRHVQRFLASDAREQVLAILAEDRWATWAGSSTSCTRPACGSPTPSSTRAPR